MHLNLQWQKTDQWLPKDRVEEGLDYNEKQETFGILKRIFLITVMFLDCIQYVKTDQTVYFKYM